MKSRRFDGKYAKLIKYDNFSLDNFSDGYITHGRFMVYYPDFPRASKNGYVLRSIAAYELYHGVQIEKGQQVHHIDGNPLNDSKENLHLMSVSEHKKEHARLKGHRVKKVCEYCGRVFEIKKSRLNEPNRNRGRFCSYKCFCVHRRNEMREKTWVKRICKHCGKEFLIRQCMLKDSARGQFCSQKCYHAHGQPIATRRKISEAMSRKRKSMEHRRKISVGLKRAYKEGRRSY